MLVTETIVVETTVTVDVVDEMLVVVVVVVGVGRMLVEVVAPMQLQTEL